MSYFLVPIFQIAYKDIILELRTKDIFVTILIFALLMGIIFSFVFVPTKEIVALILPGTLWVSITFAGVLGFNRSLTLEKDKGSLDGLLLCPVTRAAVGTLFSAICVNTRSREVMLPILLLPVSVPIIVAAVEGTRSIVEGYPMDIWRWVQLLAAFDVIFLIIAAFTFGAVLEE